MKRRFGDDPLVDKISSCVGLVAGVLILSVGVSQYRQGGSVWWAIVPMLGVLGELRLLYRAFRLVPRRQQEKARVTSPDDINDTA